jgi:hypothetical protein
MKDTKRKLAMQYVPPCTAIDNKHVFVNTPETLLSRIFVGFRLFVIQNDVICVRKCKL